MSIECCDRALSPYLIRCSLANVLSRRVEPHSSRFGIFNRSGIFNCSFTVFFGCWNRWNPCCCVIADPLIVEWLCEGAKGVVCEKRNQMANPLEDSYLNEKELTW
jgi:hypothetical protein